MRSAVDKLQKYIEAMASLKVPDELASIRTRFAELNADEWDRQIEADARTGRLDALAAEAIADLRAGRCTDR